MLKYLLVFFVLTALAVPLSANTELVVNGNFNTVVTWSSLPIANCVPWTGMTGTINSYDVASVAEHVWYATSNSYYGANGQRAQQSINGMTANTRYTFSADLRAWTDDSGCTATTSVRMYFYNSSLGAGWQYLPDNVLSYTASTSADIANFHAVSTTFDLPADFNIGSDRPVVALWGQETGGLYSAGWAWDNISLIASELPAGNPVPEPMTVLAVLMGLGGLGGYIRRRTAA